MKQESQNIEWKESWRDEHLKWISAFANSSGGVLYIGKNDFGDIVGLEKAHKLIEDLPNKIVQYLGLLVPVNLNETEGKQFVTIEVQESHVPISFRGKYYFRSGSTTQELKGSALNEFLLRKTGKTWDELIEESIKIKDLDLDAIQLFKKAALKSSRLPQIQSEDDLWTICQNLWLTKQNSLRRAAVLLFAKEPRQFYINAFIKIGKFGTTDDELLSQDVIQGNIFDLAQKAMEILEFKYFSKSISYEGLQRIETTEYPYDAIREALLNALVHKDYTGASIQISVYKDKFSIWNPGRLPEQITVQDLESKHPSVPRNPYIADVLFKAGFIEAWGRGTLKIISDCLKFGFPKPTFEEKNAGFLLTISKNEGINDDINEGINEDIKLSDVDKEILFIITDTIKITIPEIASILSKSESSIERSIKKLKEKQYIKRLGSRKDGYWKTVSHEGIADGINEGIKLSDADKEILNTITENTEITIPNLSAKLSTSESTIERTLKKLKDLNYIKRIGSRKDGYWKVLI